MSDFKPLDQFDFHSTLEETAGLSLVFFSTENCASCHYWENLLGQYKGQHPSINLFGVDAARDQALTEEFEIFHMPAIFLYVDGKFQSGIQCEAKLDVLHDEIQKVLHAPAQELP